MWQHNAPVVRRWLHGQVGFARQVVQILGPHVVPEEHGACTVIEAWSHAHEFDPPGTIRREGVQKSIHVSFEVVDVGQEFCRRAFAGTEPQSSLFLVDCHQVDLGVAPIPEAGDARGDREVTQVLPAPLLVNLPHQLLQRRPRRRQVACRPRSRARRLGGSRVPRPDSPARRARPGGSCP